MALNQKLYTAHVNHYLARVRVHSLDLKWSNRASKVLQNFIAKVALKLWLSLREITIAAQNQ